MKSSAHASYMKWNAEWLGEGARCTTEDILRHYAEWTTFKLQLRYATAPHSLQGWGCGLNDWKTVILFLAVTEIFLLYSYQIQHPSHPTIYPMGMGIWSLTVKQAVHETDHSLPTGARIPLFPHTFSLCGGLLKPRSNFTFTSKSGCI